MNTTYGKLKRALKHHRAGDLERASETYRTILRIDPAHSDALHLLGVVALQEKRYEAAIESIGRAIEENPQAAEFHNNLAIACRAAGRLDESVASYRRALDINPNYIDAGNNLENALSELSLLNETDSEPNTHQPNANETCTNETCTDEMDADEMDAADEMNFDETNTRDPIAESMQKDTSDVVVTEGVATKKVLHVGCGPRNPESLHERFRDPEWEEIRLDINPQFDPDIVASQTDMHGVADNSVDAVFSSHNLEHIFAYEVPVALAEFHRVLKPGGVAFITLPDLQQIAQFVVEDRLDDVVYESPAGAVTTLDCIFGLGELIAQGNEYMGHKTGFTVTTLTNRLNDAGFTNVRVWSSPFNLWAEATKA